MPAKSDLAEIRRTLSLLIEPGDVVEMRCPKTSKSVVSGYYNDMEKLAKDAAYWSGRAETVYFTLNPVRVDLLARAFNRAEPYSRHTTSDADILRRRLFLVDCDPVRPAGISSTDSEHEAALERALTCRAWLRDFEMGDPIYADSGNGAHLLYRIDLPNNADSEGQLSQALQALAQRFNDQAVTIDTSTFNASRICKIYGTLACKGDDVPDPPVCRPHRIARILEVPEGWA